MASAQSPIRVTPFVPEIGGFLIVQFPGEVLRCQVNRVVSPTLCIVEITSVPMAKSHQYRKGDKPGVRMRMEYGKQVWEAVDDRDFLANRSPNEPLPLPDAKAKRKAG